MILEILYTLLVATAGYVLVSYCIQLKRLKEYPPGPWPLPIIGNLHLISSEPHKALSRLGKKYGPVMSFSFGSQRFVVIQGIKEARETLITKGLSFAGESNFEILSIVPFLLVMVPSRFYTTSMYISWALTFDFLRGGLKLENLENCLP